MALYVKPTTAPGDSVRWSDIHTEPTIRTYVYTPGRAGHYDEVTGVECHEVPYCTHGDYDNSSGVERSNYRSMLRDYADELIEVHGEYGSQKLIYVGEPSEALAEAIAALESYPIIDESDLSELEMEQEQADWEDYGRHDFAKGLAEYVRSTYNDRALDTDDLLTDNKDDLNALSELWYQGVEAFLGGEGFRWEGGSSTYLPIRDWFERLNGDQRGYYADKHREILETISDIAFRRGWLVPGADAENDICIEIGITNLWRAFQ